MQPEVQAVAEAVTAAWDGEDMEAAAALLRLADQLHARAVGFIGDVERDPAAEIVGLGVEGSLREDAHRTGPEARLLVAAAERLVWLPTVARLLEAGRVSWVYGPRGGRPDPPSDGRAVGVG